VLEGVTVAAEQDLDDPVHHVRVDLDLLHDVTIQATGAVTLRIHSSVIPAMRALVVGAGPVAINVEFVEFEDLSVSQGTLDFGALKVKQIVFVQHDGEWILVLQVVRVGTATPPVDEVYAYQYVSYPTRVAEQMSESEAIEYVNTILRLASAVQRR
jgi:hypothetical protein